MARKSTGEKVTPSPTPKAPKPWDAPVSALYGDQVEDVTFAAVGRAISSWERFEASMGYVFARFLGNEANTLSATRAYGSIQTFRGRADMVEAAAEAYFFESPEPDLEKDVKGILIEARGFSGRRNEIAHGRVCQLYKIRPDSAGGFERVPNGYAVQPAVFSTNKRELAPTRALLMSMEEKPVYTYASAQIAVITRGFENLASKTSDLAQRVALHSTRIPDPSSS